MRFLGFSGLFVGKILADINEELSDSVDPTINARCENAERRFASVCARRRGSWSSATEAMDEIVLLRLFASLAEKGSRRSLCDRLSLDLSSVVGDIEIVLGGVVSPSFELPMDDDLVLVGGVVKLSMRGTSSRLLLI